MRLRHDATTFGGSSGGACFDNAFNFIALHQAGQKAAAGQLAQWNQAIPVKAIVRHMRLRRFRPPGRGRAAAAPQGDAQAEQGGAGGHGRRSGDRAPAAQRQDADGPRRSGKPGQLVPQPGRSRHRSPDRLPLHRQPPELPRTADASVARQSRRRRPQEAGGGTAGRGRGRRRAAMDEGERALAKEDLSGKRGSRHVDDRPRRTPERTPEIPQARDPGGCHADRGLRPGA